MGKSITKLVISVLVIALCAYIALFGFDIRISNWNISYPNALDENYGIRQGLDLVGGSIITYEAQAENVTAEEMQSVTNVLRKRLDALGFSEATVTTQGEKKVRVEIPSIQDPKEAVETLGQTATLTFRDSDGNIVLEGTDVKSARAAYGEVSQTSGTIHHVVLNLNDSGVSKFTEATKIASQKAEGSNYIAIMLDEEVISQPSVDSTINTSECVISGGFANAEETGELAALINSGNLPFTIEHVELRSVGPSLGEKALSTSLLAAAIGILLVMIFMAAVYKLPGLIADVSLIFYIAIIAYIMSQFRVNLSLPGIAGLILSVGMAVDANVIIFARMKEELVVGKTIRAAVDSGYKRAFIAIVDANITTLIAAVVLFFFGTGPIQGFAITLGIGTVVSMFTAIFITKFLLKQLVGLKIKDLRLYGVNVKKEEQNV
ncbi:MAG: protein translocase subunit SecD [Ruminococcaceae bacterium]|nr:protein translocase subunit SecD [Oscillospiraceae bacterium]